MSAADVTTRPRPGRLAYLSEQDKTAIYDAALEIIGTIGMRVHHPEALALLRAAGCSVTEPDLVRIPRELVEKARATAPPMIEVFGRAGEPAMSLGGFNSYFGTGSDLMSTYDLETGERRQSVLADMGVNLQPHLRAGLGQFGERGYRNGHVVSHAARLHDGLVRMLLQQHAAQQSDHE